MNETENLIFTFELFAFPDIIIRLFQPNIHSLRGYVHVNVTVITMYLVNILQSEIDLPHKMRLLC